MANKKDPKCYFDLSIPNIGGVYKISNNITKDCYVGISRKLQHRQTTHLSDLRKNKHKAKKLNEDFLEYGKENFTFSVLEYFDPLGVYPAGFIKSYLEHFYINNENSTYNSVRIPLSQFGFYKEDYKFWRFHDPKNPWELRNFDFWYGYLKEFHTIRLRWNIEKFDQELLRTLKKKDFFKHTLREDLIQLNYEKSIIEYIINSLDVDKLFDTYYSNMD